MAKIFIVVPPFTGHVNPTLSLGAVLIDRGHTVSWISVDATIKAQLPAGGELLLVAPDKSNDDTNGHHSQFSDINAKVVYGIDSIKFLYDDVLIPLNRYMFGCCLELFKTHVPDLVIADHQMFGAAMAALECNIPFVTSVTAPAALKIMEDLPKIREWEMNKILTLQHELKIASLEPVYNSPLLNLVFTSKKFFGEMELEDHYRFVGPVLSNRKFLGTFNWDAFHQNAGRPKILVSIGTTFDLKFKMNFFSKVLEAFSGNDYTVVVVADPALFDTIPENFIIAKHVPQVEMLPYLDGVVCHGGNNTVCESLSFGIPMVVIPIAYDQSHMAGRVAAVGAGLRLNFNRFKATHLREAVAEIVNNKSFGNQAKLIGASFTAAGGTVHAAISIEEILSDHALNLSDLIDVAEQVAQTV